MYSFAELAVPVGTDFLPLFFGRVINALLALALYYRFGFGFEFFVAALVIFIHRSERAHRAGHGQATGGLV